MRKMRKIEKKKDRARVYNYTYVQHAYIRAGSHFSVEFRQNETWRNEFKEKPG